MTTVHDPAVVRPRVRSSRSGELPVLLEDLIASFLERDVRGVLLVSGPPGSGRRTAIRSMRARFASVRDRVEFVEDFLGDVVEESLGLGDPRERLRVGVAWHEVLDVPPASILRMEPWSRDECIEYLLAAHPDRVASVLSRLAAAYHVVDPRGHAGTLRATMDALAIDEGVFGVDEVIERLLVGPESACSAWPPVRTYRLARDLVRALAGRTSVAELLGLESPGEMHAATMLVRRESRALEALMQLLDDADAATSARAACLANRVDARAVGEWLDRKRDDAGRVPSLARYSLDGADLSRRVLYLIDAERVRLSNADLSEADLRVANLSGSDLSHANCTGAKLGLSKAPCVNLRGADLSGANVDAGVWPDAVLAGATLRETHLCDVYLARACFDQAILVHADLSRSMLADASFVDAVVHDVLFDGASMFRVDLSRARSVRASFQEANLYQANLQGLRIPNAAFARAKLHGALLTGSWMPDADFQHADLRSTGLADVQWPGADLWHADLRGASFHFGSSRSGLVFHGPPMEGSRTGFYTDEFLQLMHQPPERVRRANLVGANLLGANITGVDFYLVDLRGARYYELQRQHFRRCGAILDDWPGPR